MKGKILITTTLFVLLVFALFSYAAPRQSRGWFRGESNRAQLGRGQGTMGLWGIPDLTDEQKEKLEELRDEFAVKVAEIRGKLEARTIELRKLWADPEATSDDILAKEAEVKALRDEIHEATLKHRLSVREVLTPEQIEKIGKAPFGRGNLGRRGGMGGPMMHRGYRGGGGFMRQGGHGLMMQNWRSADPDQTCYFM